MAPGGEDWGWDPPFQLWLQLLLWGLLLGRLLRYGVGRAAERGGHEGRDAPRTPPARGEPPRSQL